MTSPASPVPAPPRPVRFAASLILLRDGAQGLEALLLRRADKANDQNSGASVFPGGVVDAHDRELHARCAAMDDAAASARLSVPEGGLDFYAAAVRECFEEAGVLFACDAKGELVDLAQFDPTQLGQMRASATASTDALVSLCEAHGWQLAVDKLVYFSHWLTPPGMPRRFDTRFFVALMPSGQDVVADGMEIVEHMWLRPAEAVSPQRNLKLMNVTRRILEQLATFESAADCMASARAQREIQRVMPRLANGPKGMRPVNMDEAAYPEVAFVDPDGLGHGRYALDAGLVMRLSPHVLRVTGANGHSYFVGNDDGVWALIDPMPDDAAHAVVLSQAAPGPVKWLLSTRGERGRAADWPDAQWGVLAPGEQIELGGVELRALAAAHDTNARCYLLMQDRMIFTGEANGPLEDSVKVQADWLAPARGFLQPV